MARFHATPEGNVPFTPEEEAEWDAQEAAWEAEKETREAEKVRTERNEKLAVCDWTQLTDSTADKTAWATYRQALRDVPKQAGFPWNVTWPTEP